MNDPTQIIDNRHGFFFLFYRWFSISFLLSISLNSTFTSHNHIFLILAIFKCIVGELNRSILNVCCSLLFNFFLSTMFQMTYRPVTTTKNLWFYLFRSCKFQGKWIVSCGFYEFLADSKFILWFKWQIPFECEAKFVFFFILAFNLEFLKFFSGLKQSKVLTLFSGDWKRDK